MHVNKMMVPNPPLPPSKKPKTLQKTKLKKQKQKTTGCWREDFYFRINLSCAGKF